MTSAPPPWTRVPPVADPQDAPYAPVGRASPPVVRLVGEPATTQPPDRWREVAFAVAVVVLGLLEVLPHSAGFPFLAEDLLVVAGTALAVLLSRRLPGAALAVCWVSGLAQVMLGSRFLVVQLALAVVAFGTARWGSRLVVWFGGLSIPFAVGIAAFTSWLGLSSVLLSLSGVRGVLDTASRLGQSGRVVAAFGATAVLGVPWLVGVTLRTAQQARTSDESRVVAEDEAARATAVSAQAQEIARLREEQARLARDVHDVVGHSLAVILAQAESAQFLPDSDPGALKATMATIATSARTSLQDVRQVLGATRGSGTGRSGGLDSLVAGIRSSGHEVRSEVVGSPVPMPPELDAVAFRVLQEMLTNALKHGRRDAPILVERHWPSGQWDHDLRIEVRNVEDDSEETRPLGTGAVPGGKGLDGMRRRLDSVGGRLDVRRREEPDGATFTVTAWVPVRVA